MIFVIAHELLHIGLGLMERRQGRETYLWKCRLRLRHQRLARRGAHGRFSIIEGLLELDLRGLSSKEIYGRIFDDVRRFRKLATLRGVGVDDRPGLSDPGATRIGSDLDAWFRSALAQGLILHSQVGRGLLPVGLFQEILSLATSPIPWDVRLAQWLDTFFAPIERTRSYARPSRRQASTPRHPSPKLARS